LEQLCNLEQIPSYRFGFQQLVEPVEVVTAPIDVQQTQPLHQIVWPNILVMGTIEQPLVQRSIWVTTMQSTIEVALTCAYCQQVGHEFKNCPFVDDKLKRLMKKKLRTSLQPMVLSTPVTHVGVHMQQI
jgi:hypothetical protein